MRLADIKASAKEMGVPLKYAINCRINYLRQRQRELDKSLDGYLDMEGLDTENTAIANHLFLEGMKEFMAVSKEMHYLAIAAKLNGKVKQDEITDDMIERARRHPIELIIEFKRGKRRCINPEHEDNNPSMFLGRNTNRAVCPACGASYDSIAAYQLTYGVGFREAVTRLN